MFTPRAHLSQVDPDKEARATIEKRDIQCLQLVSDVLVSRAQPEVINGQVRAVKPFWTRGGRGLSQIAELRSARGFLTKVCSLLILSTPDCIVFELMASIPNTPTTYLWLWWRHWASPSSSRKILFEFTPEARSWEYPLNKADAAVVNWASSRYP